MIYGSVCSGIEAATTAWHPLGWEASFVSEIEPFPRAVLAHHYPEVPLHGDFTTIQDGEYRPIDLLVGGTPCQSFSIAGLRGGLDDDRGNLALEFLKLAKRLRPRWVVWENVPGVLSSNGGRDFGSILAGLGEIGYGFAYRVLDAQYFGLAQRRKRVFVIGYLGDWRCAAAVLFERESMRGHPAPSRSAGQKAAPCITGGPPFSRTGNDRVETDAVIVTTPHAQAVNTSDGYPRLDDIAGTLNCENTTGRGSAQRVDVFLQAVGFDAYNNDVTGDVSKTVDTGQDYHHVPNVLQYSTMAFGVNEQPYTGHCLRSGASRADKHESTTYVVASAVRRLTPTECERLQGFPDGYTAIPWKNKATDQCLDGPRYKALGNSMAVPVMRWIGERIQKVEAGEYLNEPI